MNVHDEDIVTSENPYSLSSEAMEHALVMRERLDAIRNAPVPPDDKMSELTGKQLERIAAFDLREDR